MKFNSREEVKNLMTKFCNEIENKFLNEEIVEFHNPFTVYITEDNTFDDSQVKVPYIIKRMVSGKYLIGNTFYGESFDDLSTYDLEDIVEVAYILDTVDDKSYNILEIN